MGYPGQKMDQKMGPKNMVTLYATQEKDYGWTKQVYIFIESFRCFSPRILFKCFLCRYIIYVCALFYVVYVDKYSGSQSSFHNIYLF